MIDIKTLPTFFALSIAIMIGTLKTSAQSFTFHYSYNKGKEILDTSQSTQPWYLPAHKNFTDFYNSVLAGARPKYTIDPTTGSGIYWNAGSYANVLLSGTEIKHLNGYYINVSSEGIGLEGHAIVTFFRIVDKVIHVDGSYGMFSNNSKGSYETSFYQRKKFTGRQRDSLDQLYKGLVPEADFFNLYTGHQIFTKSELAGRRKNNTSFFGIAPPDMVKRILINSIASIYTELTPEEYEFRLFKIRGKFFNSLRKIDETYLYDEFQKDWRYLLNISILTESSINERLPYWANMESYLKEKGDGSSREQNIFPQVAIQKIVLMSGGGGDKIQINDFVKRISDRNKKSFEISEANSLSVKNRNSLNTEYLIDTSLTCNSTKYLQFFGMGLNPVIYRGSTRNNKANGFGRLTLAYYCSDTLKKGNAYFVLESNFSNGIPNGKFTLYKTAIGYTPKDIISVTAASGAFRNGKLDGEITRNSFLGQEKSVATYKDGIFQREKEFSFTNFDPLPFKYHIAKLSKFYSKYYRENQLGIEVPADSMITNFSSLNSFVTISENVISIATPSERIFIPYHRDYLRMEMVPDGKVIIFYNNGGKLISNWDSQHLIGGTSYYFWPEFNNWFEAKVANGVWSVRVETRSESGGGGLFGRIVGAVKTFVTAPAKIAETAIDIGRGKADLKDLANAYVNSYISQLGSGLQLNGELIRILGPSGVPVVSLPFKQYKALSDFTKNALIQGWDATGMVLTKAVLGKDNFLNKSVQDLSDLYNKYGNKYSEAVQAAETLLMNASATAGVVIDKLGYYMTLASTGFPPAIQNIDPTIKISNPSAKLNISNAYFEQIFNNIFNHKIDVNQDLISSIEIKGAKLINFDNNYRSINISFSDGEVIVKATSPAITNKFTIKGCNLQLIPTLKIKEGKYFLDFSAVITYLDLKYSNPIIDKMIAWALQIEFLNIKPVASIDLSKLLDFDIDFKLTGKKDLKTNTFEIQNFGTKVSLEQFAYDISEGRFLLFIKSKIKQK
jgi:hypothetical protein